MSTHNKVIFLDFDGVIRLSTTTPSPKAFEFVPSKIQLIKKLCYLTDAQVVVSSSWREIYTLDRMRLEMFNILEACDFHEYWMTPILRSHTKNDDKLIPRGAEISTWLYNHTDVTNYVILDDLPSSDFNDHISHFVSCNAATGITDTEIAEAKQILTSS